jgi:hypothetical protein
VTGPERRARVIARGAPYIAPRKLAKDAGVRVEVAKPILAGEAARREAA